MQIGLVSAEWHAPVPGWDRIYAYMASSTRKGAMPELAGNIHGILSIYKHSPVCDICMVCGSVNGRPTSTLYGWVQLNDCMGHREGSYLSPAWDLPGRCFRGMWPPVEQHSPSALQYCWSAYTLYPPSIYNIFNPAMHVPSPCITSSSS